MIDIHLHGSLKDEFKEKYTLAIESPAEGIRALCCQFPKFERTIKNGNWQVILGPIDSNTALESEEKINSRFGVYDQMHIVPAAQGAGNASTWLGVALIGASFLMPGAIAVAGFSVSATTVGFVGAALATYGVVSSLSEMPAGGDAGSREQVAQRPSYLFDGPTNTSSEGLPVPIVIGEVLTGGIVVNAGLSVDQLPPDDD